jgi:septal ring factor EnvC (AmiA/AmiB activator)
MIGNESVWSVLITLITVLGGSAAWRFYEKRAIRKERDEDFIRNDCRDRIAKLEALLSASSQEKDNMRATILDLTEKLAQLTVKVEFLQKENAELMSQILKRNTL